MRKLYARRVPLIPSSFYGQRLRLEKMVLILRNVRSKSNLHQKKPHFVGANIIVTEYVAVVPILGCGLFVSVRHQWTNPSPINIFKKNHKVFVAQVDSFPHWAEGLDVEAERVPMINRGLIE